MDLDHLAKGDEADKGVGQEERERHLERFLEGPQLVLHHGGVHHHQEARGHGLRGEADQRGFFAKVPKIPKFQNFWRQELEKLDVKRD